MADERVVRERRVGEEEEGVVSDGQEQVDLLKKERLVLDLLLREDRPMFGLELVEKSDGELVRGLVYITLSRLEGKGYVGSYLEDKQPFRVGRRLYYLTREGKRALEGKRGEQES